MERLTERVEGIGVIGAKLRKYDDPLRVIESLAAKLAAYEDTGLSPKAVSDLVKAQAKPGFQLDAPNPPGTKFYAEAQAAWSAAVEKEKRSRMEIGGNIGATD